MKKFIITEEEKQSIRGMYLLEEENKDLYSDLYGKTVTYKDQETGVEVMGKIKSMIYVEPDGVHISHEKIFVSNYKESGYVIGKVGTDDTGSVAYDCDDKTFYINLQKIVQGPDAVAEFGSPEPKVVGNVIRIKTFTCKGLSDILSQRYPCVTDFSMNKNNVSNTTPNNLS